MSQVDRRVLLGAAGVLGAAALSRWTDQAQAGPLNPPAGPVSSTPGPEPRIALNATNTPGDNDSVYRITAPGSYYLTASVLAIAGKHGIEVNASNVTIDLMGFTLSGVSSGGFHGVRVVTGFINIAIRNGTLASFGGLGVSSGGDSSLHCQDVRCIANAGGGLTLGQRSTAVRCAAIGCGADGLFLSSHGHVADCVAHGNSGNGINIANWSSVVGSVANENTGHGFDLANSTFASRCVAGINSLNGINAPNDAVVEHCVSGSNVQSGIVVGNACLVSDCQVSQNDLHGISAASYSKVMNNVCRQSGAFGTGTGGGVHVPSTASGVHVEGNHCTGGDRGYFIEGDGNLIVRNVASGNSINYSIVANNKVGTIVAAGDSAAISGSAGGAGVGTTNYWSNLTI